MTNFMTDKETLILAAKAMGMIGWVYDEHTCSMASELLSITPTVTKFANYWTPLESSGDCFRLETELGLDIVWWKDRVVVWGDSPHGYTQEYFADHNGDKDKARRYASTRAAALIGAE